MLETIISPKKAERKPWEMFLIGFIYATLAIFISNFLFLKNHALEQYTGIFILLLTVIFSLPLMYHLIRYEEKKGELIHNEKILIKEHGRALAALLFLFLGFVVAFSILYLVLPTDIANLNFQSQIRTFCLINSRGNIEECIKSITAGSLLVPNNIKEGMNYVASILATNLAVFFNCLIFSLLFGAGAIFILAWNASVIATAIGIFARKSSFGLFGGFARYMLHGLPEIAGFFVAALAGGIIGIAMIRHRNNKKQFFHVLHDSIELISLGLVILIFAAFIEVFVTPLIIPLL
ncbi:MAG: stage II sporulation protein M [Candidatus Pacearchaeota archaeon]|nr:stage II sporulation protein M [Candidatus Pacearchaeota archaeon]